MTSLPPRSALFPYTTLFRSIARIIELELINTHQRVFLEYFNGSRKAQGTNQIGIFHKRSERFRSEEHTSELQSRGHLVCRLLLEKNKDGTKIDTTHDTSRRK